MFRMISEAYFNLGWAWYSIQKLQMEQTATLGRAEPPADVAQRMSVIYTTLDFVSPRFSSGKHLDADAA